MYVGHRNKRIVTVGDRAFSSENLKIAKVPDDLLGVSKESLMENYEVWRGNVVKKNSPKDPKSLRVAFVGVYNIKCGIATYAEALFPAIGALVGDYRIFAERAGLPPSDNLVQCWSRGQPLTDLINAIDDYDPDIVLVQHEYGIFPVARHWLAFMSSMQRYKTFVTLHSVYKHKDKTICEAAIPNIIVHTDIGKTVLKQEKKVPGVVTVIPHFCIPCKDTSKHWNLYHSLHTIVQFGFGFRYKGWEQAIEVVAQLKKEYPDIFFTGLFSESDFSKNQHDQYFYELYDLIKEKNVSQNVALIRGYQSDETLDAYLRTNQVAMFPYIENGEHTVFGCSGAARFTMRTGIPVIASNAPLFDDLEGVCPRPKSVEELCAEVRKLFNDPSNVKDQQERQRLFLVKNSLENVAKLYVNSFVA